MSEQDNSTYPGGFDAIVAQMQTRTDPLQYGPGEALPDLDVDLQSLKQRLMDRACPELGESRSTYARKYRELSKEFLGRSALLHLHGLLIANLRRDGQPPQTAQLFVRLWAEESDYLLARLDPRWLVSAVTTFGDHGLTELQRSTGHALSVLFGMMKLYETERLFSGSAPDQPFAWRRKSAPQLAMEMDNYAIAGSGGLDVNMLGRLWQEGSRDPVMAPLVQRLLTLLIEDDKTVFRRLQIMRSRKQKQRDGKSDVPKAKAHNPAPVLASRVVTDPAQIKWGTVSLIKAPLDRILRFASFHLDLGAHRVHIYLDDPEPETARVLSLHPKIEVTACDEAYWSRQKKRRMKSHRMRQVWAATQAYNSTDCHWLAHVDVDEFIISDEDVAAQLSSAPADAAALQLTAAEQLETAEGPELFKLLPKTAGRPRAVLSELYPNFGDHLRGGFISHTEGKLFLRTGVDGLRFGIHAAHFGGFPITNIATRSGIFIGHAHAPSWQEFLHHLDFRMTGGSYRKTEDEQGFKVADLLHFLTEEEGEEALKAFFEEVCVARPDLVRALRDNGMLLRYPLDLEARVARIYGPLLEDQT